jgi:hypothetical protein
VNTLGVEIEKNGLAFRREARQQRNRCLLFALRMPDCVSKAAAPPEEWGEDRNVEPLKETEFVCTHLLHTTSAVTGRPRSTLISEKALFGRSGSRLCYVTTDHT